MKMETLERNTEAVFRDHLELRLAGKVEEDVRRNYAEDIVLISAHGIFHGHEGVLACAARLANEIPHACFSYKRQVVVGEIAFLEWTAAGDGVTVEDGVDTFVIRGGRIVAKTVRYTVKPSAACAPAARRPEPSLPRARSRPA